MSSTLCMQRHVNTACHRCVLYGATSRIIAAFAAAPTPFFAVLLAAASISWCSIIHRRSLVSSRSMYGIDRMTSRCSGRQGWTRQGVCAQVLRERPVRLSRQGGGCADEQARAAEQADGQRAAGEKGHHYHGPLGLVHYSQGGLPPSLIIITT